MKIQSHSNICTEGTLHGLIIDTYDTVHVLQWPNDLATHKKKSYKHSLFIHANLVNLVSNKALKVAFMICIHVPYCTPVDIIYLEIWDLTFSILTWFCYHICMATETSHMCCAREYTHSMTNTVSIWVETSLL